MSFNAYDSQSMETPGLDTFRGIAHVFKVSFEGLRPKTKHRMYLEGTDYTWACRGFGQNLGEEILSDEFGNATLNIYYEVPYSMGSRYEFTEKNSISDNVNKIGRQNSRMQERVHTNYKTFTLKSSDELSIAYYQMRFTTVLVDGDYNRPEQHD